MNKVIGYIVAVVGLVVMTLGFGIIKKVDLLGIPSVYVSGAGIILVVVGVVISMKSEGGGGRKVDEGKNEIPIYEGVGKKRRIVGYRTD